MLAEHLLLDYFNKALDCQIIEQFVRKLSLPGTSETSNHLNRLLADRRSFDGALVQDWDVAELIAGTDEWFSRDADRGSHMARIFFGCVVLSRVRRHGTAGGRESAVVLKMVQSALYVDDVPLWILLTAYLSSLSDCARSKTVFDFACALLAMRSASVWLHQKESNDFRVVENIFRSDGMDDLKKEMQQVVRAMESDSRAIVEWLSGLT